MKEIISQKKTTFAMQNAETQRLHMDELQIKSMVKLLDDPDQEIYEQIKNDLLNLGTTAIPFLENEWEQSFDAIKQQRIEDIVHQIQLNGVKEKLTAWGKDANNDLLDGVLILARYQYPDIDEQKIIQQLEQIKKDIWIESTPSLTALEQVKLINHVIYDVHQFGPNITNFHAPQNSYINDVLVSKKGNPLSLGIIYIILAQSLSIPIYGVNLPEHFILCYKDEPHQTEILFYINPFNKGVVFEAKEIDAFLHQLKLSKQDSFYQPCSNKAILIRNINNLILSYSKLGQTQKVKELTELLKLLGSS